MSDVIAVMGSARKFGNTRDLLDCVAKSVSVNIVDLNDLSVSFYDYEYNNRGDDFLSLIKKLLKYEKIILATPIYWYAPSAQMKAFIDRITDLLDVDELKSLGRQLRGKKVWVLCSSANDEAGDVFLKPIEATLAYLGMQYKGYLHARCDSGFREDEHLYNIGAFADALK